MITSLYLIVMGFIALCMISSFIIKQKPYHRTQFVVRNTDTKNDGMKIGPDDKNNVIKDNEKAVVSKGLTHIKYNKYAPTAEEAKNMTDVEFRATIYNRMKEADAERKALNGNRLGGVVSDDYIASLNRKRSQQ